MGGIGELWRIPSSGAGSAERVSASDDFASVALTAEWLVAARYRPTTSRSLQVVGRRMHGDSNFVSLFASTAFDATPELSRDGRWLAYVSDGSGHRELFVRPFPQADAGMTAVSSGGVTSAPIWAPDSRTLYYVNGDQKLVAVSSQPGAVFQVGARRELFDASRYLDWSMSPDGSRFLAIRISGARTPTRLFLIENLPALLKREAATPATAR
jgi:serine/threonine-protein kinase